MRGKRRKFSGRAFSKSVKSTKAGLVLRGAAAALVFAVLNGAAAVTIEGCAGGTNQPETVEELKTKLGSRGHRQ